MRRLPSERSAHQIPGDAGVVSTSDPNAVGKDSAIRWFLSATVECGDELSEVPPVGIRRPHGPRPPHQRVPGKW